MEWLALAAVLGSIFVAWLVSAIRVHPGFRQRQRIRQLINQGQNAEREMDNRFTATRDQMNAISQRWDKQESGPLDMMLFTHRPPGMS